MTKRKDWVKEGPSQSILRGIRSVKHNQYSERLSHSDLMDLIKEYSGYHKYEIEDILYFTAVAIAEIIASGRAVQFKGVGYFAPKQRKPFKFRNAFFEGRKTLTNPRKSISLAPDILMRNLLNLPEETLDLIINEKLKDSSNPKEDYTE